MGVVLKGLLLAYRVTVILLLLIIAMNLGLWRWLVDSATDARRAIASSVHKEEAPAPRAHAASAPNQVHGIDSAYQAGTDAVLQDMIDRPKRPQDNKPK